MSVRQTLTSPNPSPGGVSWQIAGLLYTFVKSLIKYVVLHRKYPGSQLIILKIIFTSGRSIMHLFIISSAIK